MKHKECGGTIVEGVDKIFEEDHEGDEYLSDTEVIYQCVGCGERLRCVDDEAE